MAFDQQLTRVDGIDCHSARLSSNTGIDLAVLGFRRKFDNFAFRHAFLRGCLGVSLVCRAENEIPILLRRGKRPVGEIFCL